MRGFLYTIKTVPGTVFYFARVFRVIGNNRERLFRSTTLPDCKTSVNMPIFTCWQHSGMVS